MEFLKANWKKIAIAVAVLVVAYIVYVKFVAKDEDEADNTKLGGTTPLQPAKATSTDAKVQASIDKIYATPDWYKLAQDNAVKKGITEAESVLAEAMWVNRPK